MLVLHLDGSLGEGGGQVLRTALTLSLVTGTPVHLRNIRARRPRPGLRPQHLAAVHAAAAVGRAALDGASLDSTELYFMPDGLSAGEHAIQVGTAGSTTLVLQTVLPALLCASEPSRVVVEGGTHNPKAPSFEFLERAYVRQLRALGQDVHVDLARRGFYPRGGGRIVATLEPGTWRPLSLEARGRATGRYARAVVAALPRHVAERELATVAKKLGWPPSSLETVEAPADEGPGNALLLEVAFEHLTEVVSAYGRPGLAAERVAGGAVRELKRYLKSGAVVGEHLADQLLLPLALGAGGSFLTAPLSSHAATNLEVIRAFLDVDIEVTPVAAGRVRVVVRVPDESAP